METTSESCGSSGAGRVASRVFPARIFAVCSKPVSTGARPEPKPRRFRGVDNVRALEPLWHLRQRRHAVVACLDDAGALDELRPFLRDLRAELVVEANPGPLSAALGRPSVTVASKFGRIGWQGTSPDLPSMLEALEAFELACPECGPQAWGDPGA